MRKVHGMCAVCRARGRLTSRQADAHRAGTEVRVVAEHGGAEVGLHVGFGCIVVSEIEALNFLANLV